MGKVNPTVPLMVTARELAVLRKAVPYEFSFGTLSDKLAEAEKASRIAVREARKKRRKD